ncbi:hypothetical protein F4778DRAFT_548490 [Xylariomycetidae sp. FL2044]|nr:hypothetical protein F4778DRAFT_548490 [Xylariomycetidae sp. FL2044]
MTMDTSVDKPHLGIFNPRCGHNVDHQARFMHFPQLPKELRLQIWERLLHRQRMVRARLEPTQYSDRPALPGTKRRYEVVADGRYHMSKLFRVNSESRAACMSFYRVHIPCWLSHGMSHDPQEEPGILYFNPEYDVLNLVPPSAIPVKETFYEFLHDLKTDYDPRRVGLLNIAFARRFLDQSDLKKIMPSDLDSGVKESVTRTLSQLHEVFFEIVSKEGRRGAMEYGNELHANLRRSYPVASSRPTFERLPRDPRAVARDLKEVCIGMPIEFYNFWKQGVLNRFGVDGSKTRHQILLANAGQIGPHRRVENRGDMEALLQNEYEEWAGMVKDWDYANERKPERSDAELREYWLQEFPESDMSAVGFWLFPIEAFLQLPREKLGLPLVDLSHSWPELCLTELPDGDSNV